MQIITHKMEAADLSEVDQCNEPFTVDSRLMLDLQDGRLKYTIVPAEPYEKTYPLDEVAYSTYVNNPDKAVFFAYVEEELAGQIRIHKFWNQYAYIHDIAVKAQLRRRGVGRALMAAAIEWAKETGFPGLMLETQDINVAACLFYERCGFQLGGFDRLLYRAQDPDTEEVALFWYLLF